MRKQDLRKLGAGLFAALLLGMAACGAANESASSPSMAAQYNGVAGDSAMKTAGMADYGYTDGYAAESYVADSYNSIESGLAHEEGYTYPEEASGSSGTVTESQSASDKNTNRKLIRNVNMNVETQEFDEFLASVEEQVNVLGGYIENMDTYNGSRYGYDSYYSSQSNTVRYSNLTVRIPQKKLDDFLDAVSEAGHVISRGESVEDVTLTYVDMESRRNSLQTEMDRLQEFLEKAETLEDVIMLEDRMSTVRYQLESMESQLRTYDNMVDYSTVTMRIQEVKELTEIVEDEETAWERLANGFMDSLEDVKDGLVDFGIWFVVHIPYLLVWVVVIAIIVWIIKAIIRRNRRKKEARLKKMNESRQQQPVPVNGANAPQSGKTGQ